MFEISVIVLYIVIMLLVFKMPKRPGWLSGKSTVQPDSERVDETSRNEKEAGK